MRLLIVLALTVATALDWVEALITRGAHAEDGSSWEEEVAMALRATTHAPRGELGRTAPRRPSPPPNF